MDVLPFIPEQIYNRRKDIHAIYGGNWQSGICPTSKYNYIFIFSGKSGKQHGYEDGWDNQNIFTYTGEGQIGDMQFTRGNLALRDHLKNATTLNHLHPELKARIIESVTKPFPKSDDIMSRCICNSVSL